MAIKVSIINFKGGVGKTTLSFHLGTYLAQNSKVLLVDIDHQSSLSIVLLGGNLWENCASQGKTVNRVFESFCSRKVKMPDREIIFPNPLNSRSPKYDFYPLLDLVPAQFELDDTEIELASTTVGGATRSEWEKRTLLASWLDSIDADNIYDFILFDCPPATKLVSQNALAASNFYLIPVIPDEMSTRGLTHFQHLVKNKVDAKLEFLRNAAAVTKKDVPSSYIPDTKIAGIVPFMAKPAGNAISGMTNIHTEQIRRLRRDLGNKVSKNIVKYYSGVAEAMDSGWPVRNTYVSNATPAVIRMMTLVCEEIEDRLRGKSTK